MEKRTLIKDAYIINEGKRSKGSVVIEGSIIKEVLPTGEMPKKECDDVIEAKGLTLIPGVIDGHVHFRDPGLTYKATVRSESMAAAAGGVTSIMDMPNTKPQTITLEAWKDKMQHFAENCLVNYSCYFGATNDNIDDLAKLDVKHTCGVKVFMGASTGNMLVNDNHTLQCIFKKSPILVATHCEDQQLIDLHMNPYKGEYDLPIQMHSEIRNELVCYNSSSHAVKLAQEYGTRLHLLHLTTEMEMQMLESLNHKSPNITAEICVPHLVFSELDYIGQGARIKCNPAVKSNKHRMALRRAVKTDIVDTIATDHAPHLEKEKEGGAIQALSGIPSIQYSLLSVLSLADKGNFPLHQVVKMMCHNPAKCFNIEDRGFIKPGYAADLVLLKHTQPYQLDKSDILSLCGWTPLDHTRLTWKVNKTFVNGHLVYDKKIVDADYRGEALLFNR